MTSEPFLFKKCFSNIGYFKTILQHCTSNNEINDELKRRNISVLIDYEWNYQSFITYYQTFTHSNHLYSVPHTNNSEPIIYRQKKKKSTLLSLIEN